MSDRLSELVRQRALMLEHLAWIDREIADANMLAPAIPATPAVPPVTTTPVPPSPATPGVSAAPAPSAATNAGSVASAQSHGTTGAVSVAEVRPPSPSAATPAPAGVADEVLEQFRVSPKAVHQDVRKGCLLYFVGAFVVLGIVVAILYFTISSR